MLLDKKYFFQEKLARKAIAEFIGTVTPVLSGCGSAVIVGSAVGATTVVSIRNAAASVPGAFIAFDCIARATSAR
jgi:glycerol uptake facilitator-like aquaporin